jgi:hypothetical protein
VHVEAFGCQNHPQRSQDAGLIVNQQEFQSHSIFHLGEQILASTHVY